ncbi:MAG: hypothetical protein J7518_20335 [Nocardioidaceae bacterium]|nr:hypothetical protein [Nocardioidaceae bacterium]
MTTVLAPSPRERRAATGVERGLNTEPPAVLVWTCRLVVVAAVAMGVVGALRTGISWDEPYHVMRLRNWFDHDWFALDWAFGGDGPTGGDTNTAVYGPVAMLLLHGLTALLGVEGWHEVSTSPAAYDVRHLGVLLIGLAGTAAAASITKILLGSWRWALVTAATLLALPMWTGHLMFNIKDVPVATGYTLVTLALMAMVAPVRGHRALRVLGLAAGVVLMVGTRPAMASAVVVGLAVLAAGLLTAGRFGNARTALAEAIGGVLLAALTLLALYPGLFAHPGHLLQSAEQSTSFRGGRDAVYGYVPFFVAAQTPLLLLGFFGVGLAAALSSARRRWRTDTARTTRIVLVAAQLLALPLVAMLKHSDLYNGLRQLLFAAPAWAVLTTLGLARALAWGRVHGRLRVVGGVALLALVAPVLDQVTLFPYQYTYYNAALDLTGAHVPSDYWRTSVPELLPRIPADGQVVCGPTRSSRLGAVAGSPGANGTPADQLFAGRYSSDSSVDCRTDPLGPLSSAWSASARPLTDALPHDEFYALIDRDHEVPRNCTRLEAVTRHRHGREVAMTYVARCRLEPAELGADPVAFRRTDAEPNMPPPLWQYAPEGWVMRASASAIDSAQREATLTFATDCAGSCALVLDADAPADLTATVNDRPVAATPSSGGVAVRLPAGTTTAWVVLRRTSGSALDLRLRSVRVIPQQGEAR